MSDSEVSTLKEWNVLGEICSEQFVSDSGNSDWSEFGQTGRTVFVSGIDLIVKTHKKKFQVITDFGHSAFITSQSLFVPTNVVLKIYLACWTFCKCQSYSNESYLSERTLTYQIDADNQLHNCVCGVRCLSRWRCYKYTCKITTEKNDELQLLWSLCIAVQNPHQKIINGGLDIIKLTKIPLIYSVSRFNLGG